ncbi:MAG: FAD-binding oxidoreductase [Elusimicrobiota bacterium]
MIIKTDPDIIQSYFEDESGLLGGHAEQVAIPGDERDVADFLKEASSKKTPVTVSGAGTGVTGGRIPFGGAVLSLENLNRFIELKKTGPNEAAAVVQPGLSIKDLKNTVQKEGWMYPPDPTEQNSWIGGNVSTNASGSRGLKYGSTRKYVKRLKVVLSGGEILDIKRGEIFADKSGKIILPAAKPDTVMLPSYRLPVIKNAAGYFNYPGADLIDLFIGHEGTLGVITEIEVSLIPQAEKMLGGVAFFGKPENAWDFAANAKRAGKSGSLSPLSLEYFDEEALRLLKSDYPHIPSSAKAAIFFEQEIHGGGEDAVITEWSSLLEKHGSPLEDVWFSSAPKDNESFREFRHRLPEKVNEIVKANKFPKTGTDFAVPDANLKQMIRHIYELLEQHDIRHLVFGHIGESHLHANLLPCDEKQYAKCREIYLLLVDKAVSLGGTISAEHGIGKLKHAYLERMLGRKALIEMAELKKTLDPACVLGIGNIFPKDLL